MKKLLLVIVVLLVIVLVAFGVRTLGARDETDAVSAHDASKLVGGDTTAPDDINAGLRPIAGTYSYTGSGSENVSVLGGSKHDFPTKIATVVKLDPDDSCAWTLNVVYVKQHIEERSFCTTKSGLVDRGFERRIEFFNQLETKTYTCNDDAKRLITGAAVGDSNSWTCKQGTKAQSAYRATNLGPSTIEVDGAPVKTTHVRIVSQQTGDTRGGDVQEIWYLPTGLPAKFTGKLTVTTASVLGDTRFHEQYVYTLASLTPVGDGAT